MDNTILKRFGLDQMEVGSDIFLKALERLQRQALEGLQQESALRQRAAPGTSGDSTD
ncbi:MAG: hypothetical protein U1F23_08555 [Lysobacterales bacterium]